MGGSIPKHKIQTITITKDCTGEKIDVAFTKKVIPNNSAEDI